MNLLRKQIVVLVVFFAWGSLSGQQNGSNTAVASAPVEMAEYRIMQQALEIADLKEVLAESGPFTVFAPSDAAFQEIENENFLEWLKPEHYHKLRALLTYHIVAGKLTASSILRALARGKGSASFTTVQGEELLATLDGSDIVLTDCSGNRARIISADKNQDNLVFHEIDKVILPRPL